VHRTVERQEQRDERAGEGELAPDRGGPVAQVVAAPGGADAPPIQQAERRRPDDDARMDANIELVGPGRPLAEIEQQAGDAGEQQ
jgi:hypothetical protein